MEDATNGSAGGDRSSAGDESDDVESDKSLSWTTTERENAYACPGFSIVHEAVTLPDGTKTDFDYLHDGPSVVILPFTPGGEMVIIEEWRQAVKRVTRSFPAGGVEPGEGYHEAAHRELAEETGYEAQDLTLLATFEPANGISDAVFHYFVATDCEPTATQNLDSNESIRVDTTDLEALLADLYAGDIKDGRTALGLLRYVIEDLEAVPVSPP